MNINDIEIKEDSAVKIASIQGEPTKYYLFADEFNTLVKAAKNPITRVGKWNRTVISDPPPDEPEIGEFIKGFFAVGHYIEGFVIDTDLSVIGNIDIRLEHKNV